MKYASWRWERSLPMTVMSRGALFEAAWERPLTDLAADLGITSTGLKKICDRHDIPTPGRGYWAQVRAGRTFPRPKLRPARTADLEQVGILGAKPLPAAVKAALLQAKEASPKRPRQRRTGVTGSVPETSASAAEPAAGSSSEGDLAKPPRTDLEATRRAIARARVEGRSTAADLTARLNFDEGSSLRGLILQHTNPNGMIRDTAIQRVLMNSLSDGVMRELVREPGGERKCLSLVSNYFRAVQKTFPEDWFGHKPATSRLVHGAGIQAMGHVMEVLALLDGARKADEFAVGLQALRGRTAWRSGNWDFGGGDVRHWKAVQNLNRDVVSLAHHLISIVRADIRARRAAPTPAPLLEALTGTDS